MNHDEVIEALGAYALDAMDPDEAEVVRRHVEECPRCAQELTQLQHTAALLGNVGGEAPEHLWDQIAGRLGEVRPEQGPHAMPATISPILARSTRKRPKALTTVTRRPWVLGVAAAAVVIALLSAQVVRLNDRVGTLNALNSSASLNQLARSALNSPGAETIALESANASGGTDAQVVVLPSGAAYLMNSALPRLPASETYQLWGRAGKHLISLGVLGDAPKTVAFTVKSASTYQAYVITAEHAGGVVKSTHAPVATSGVLST
ncbi:MAG: anti-sigma factor domain-containing protein [Acidimicrobiales bacterium]